MQTTTNYELRKYESGDLFNPLTVNNPNLDDIDADMKAISDRAIGRATELVSQGVHAITLLDTDCKTFKFVATGNYSAGETFTVNGIQCNVYTPSGSALTSNAFVTGSVVLGALNEDGTAITFYVTGSAVADDSLKLGGELPSYYATQADMTNAEIDITNLQNQAGITSIVGIGDGTLSGAISSINTAVNSPTTYDTLLDYITTVGTFTINDITDYKLLTIYLSVGGTYVDTGLTIPPSYLIAKGSITLHTFYGTEGRNATITLNSNTNVSVSQYGAGITLIGIK